MHEITLPVGFHADPVWLRKDASLWPGVPLQGWCRHQLPHSGLGTLRMGRGLRMRGRARGESKVEGVPLCPRSVPLTPGAIVKEGRARVCSQRNRSGPAEPAHSFPGGGRSS